MRRFARILMLVGLLAGLCAVLALTSLAQEPSDSPANTTPTGEPEGVPTWKVEEAPPPTPTAEPLEAPPVPAYQIVPLRVYTPTLVTGPILDPDAETLFTFGQLGLGEERLVGPSSGTDFVFGLPAHWELIEGSEVQLDLSTSIVSATGLEPTKPITYPREGVLYVFFNGEWLASIPIAQIVGEHSVVVPITAEALASSLLDTQNVLSLWLDASYECLPGSDLHTTLVVRKSSRFLLLHRLVSPTTDLRLLPRPIYQGSFLPERALMVVPDEPTTGELQAALVVAAGFGQMTDGDLDLSLIPVGQLTSEVRGSTHLIFVGKSDAFVVLDQASLPAGVHATDFQAAGAAAADGVLQMAVSPWNGTKVVFLVSGDSDEAVIKAAQAVGTGAIVVARQSNLAFVSEVKPQIAIAEKTPVDRTLADLGYSAVELNGMGIQVAEFRFNAQPGQDTTNEAYFDLVYNYSAYLNHWESGISVRLNDQPIGSFDLGEGDTVLKTVRSHIPRSALRRGSNLLTVTAYHSPWEWDVCAPLNLDSLWITIQPESLLHFPYGSLEPESAQLPFDLARYPEPFVPSPVLLGDTAFVVAPDDPAGWNTACRIASDLGSAGTRQLVGLVVVFGDAVPEDVRQERHLLVVGRPSKLPLIYELGDVLPAPFEEGTEIAMPQNDLRVDFRVPPGTSMGYLELLPAPWNSDRAVLAALGSTDQGIGMAGTALISPTLRGQLVGNFAIVEGSQVVASHLRHEAEE